MFIFSLKKFLWFILISSLLLIAFRVTALEGIPSNTLIGFNFFEMFVVKDKVDGFFVVSLTKFISLLIPIFLITIIEMLQYSSFSSEAFRLTSIAKIYNSKGVRYADVWYFFFELFRAKISFITIFLTLGLSNIGLTLSDKFDSLYSSLSLPSNKLFLTFLFIFSMFLNDFYEWFSHYLQHKIPFLWDFHELHHSSTEMTILSKERGTPFQGLFQGFAALPFTIFNALIINKCLSLGFLLPCYIYFFDEVIFLMSSYLGHSQLKILFPKPLSYIYMSPSLHWIHHSSNPSHFDKNFNMKYPIWDKIFGTYLDEQHLNDITSYGIAESQYNKYHPFYSYSFLPVLKLSKSIRRVFS